LSYVEQVLKKDPRVLAVSVETDTGDGYWVYLKPGWFNPRSGCHLIHEWTLPRVRAQLKHLVKCTCRKCTISDKRKL